MELVRHFPLPSTLLTPLTNFLLPRGNYAGFFWAGSCFLSIVYTYFRLPEPKGRSFAELDVLFERKISARKFATTEVDVFENHQNLEGTDAFGEYEKKVDANVAVRTESVVR